MMSDSEEYITVEHSDVGEYLEDGILSLSQTPEIQVQQLRLLILRWVTYTWRPLKLEELSAVVEFATDGKFPLQEAKLLIYQLCGSVLDLCEDGTVAIANRPSTGDGDDDRNDQQSDVSELERLILIRVACSQGSKGQSSLENSDSEENWSAAVSRLPAVDHRQFFGIMAQTCLKYLFFCCPDVAKKEDGDDTGSDEFLEPSVLLLKFPIFEYAADHWHLHANQAGNYGESLLTLMDEFMEGKKKAFIQWHRIKRPGFGDNIFPLHIATELDLSSYLYRLIKRGQDVNNTGNYLHRTPLSVAAWHGNSESVAALLALGADIDIEDRDGFKPIHHAARRNHFATVRLLLAAGASPLTAKTKESAGRHCGNAPKTTGHTAWRYACLSGSAESVQEMMPLLHPDPETLNDGLCLAAAQGKAIVVACILKDTNANVNAKRNGETALHLAASSRDSATILALLQNSADINITSKVMDVKRNYFPPTACGRTPLHGIASHSLHKIDGPGCEESLRVLLEAGCDINAVDGGRKALLHYAVSSSAFPVSTIKMLLECGANVTALAADGSTPLHLASNSKFVELLLQYNADLGVRRYDGKLPLHTLLKSQALDSSCINTILQSKVDVDSQDFEGNTPLHSLFSTDIYLRNTDTTILKALVDAGANPNIANRDGETCFHTAVSAKLLSGSPNDFFPTLLSANANLEAKDSRGQTPLFKYINDKGNNMAMLKALRDLGAKVETRDFSGRGLLHALISPGYGPLSCGIMPIMRLLIAAGADPKGVDNEGNTLLHTVAMYGHEFGHTFMIEAFDSLVKERVSVTAKNNSQRTILSLLAGKSWKSRRSPVRHNSVFEQIRNRYPGLDSNERDVNGIAPIHLAATISEINVDTLLNAGADPTATTLEGQTALHIACRSRQSNIVGLLVKTLLKRDLVHFIDTVDVVGRRPLHYACRSGRPESVKFLLDAGASPFRTDKQDLTPLHACAEFQEEDRYWRQPNNKPFEQGLDATNILLNDCFRPRDPDRYGRQNKTKWSGLVSENDTVRIPEIIRMLVSKGATFEDEKFNQGVKDHLMLCATSLGCDEMVIELQKLRGNSGNGFEEWYLASRIAHFPSIPENLIQNPNTTLKIDLFSDLVRLGNHQLIEEFVQSGIDLAQPEPYGDRSCLDQLVKFGYTSLMEKYKTHAIKINDPAWIAEIETGKIPEGTIKPLLHTACNRKLDNLEMIRWLVNSLGVDINYRSRVKTKDPGHLHCNHFRCIPGPTAMHILAAGNYWWQVNAIEFLLDCGAMIEARDEMGKTPLHRAIGSGRAYWHVETTETLLRRGADPNAVDADGKSCLGRAG